MKKKKKKKKKKKSFKMHQSNNQKNRFDPLNLIILKSDLTH